MLTEKDYCDKDLSDTLIEMGFRGFGHFYYEKDSSKLKATHQFLTRRTAKALGHTLAVSLYEAQKWLREAKDVLIIVCPYTYNIINKTRTWTCEIWFGDNLEYEIHDFKSYEEALFKGIKEAVTILKDGIGE